MQDFLATVLVFTFTSFHATVSLHSILTSLSQVQPFGCVLRDVFCSCVWDFYSRGKRVATWPSRCFLKSLYRHTCYRCSVFVFFNTDRRKNRRYSYKKKRRPCVLSNISIVAISVGLPAAVNNPVPASQVGIQQFLAISCFWMEGSNKRSDRGHSSNDLEFFTDRTFRASFSEFRKLIDAFHFFLATMSEGASQVD